MSCLRFQNLLRCFNCHSKENQDSNDSNINKIHPIVNSFLKKFQNAYNPKKYIALDESLLLFRGRLRFRVYNKGKKAKYSTKFYELTTHDGYVLNMEIYQGQHEGETDRTTSKTRNLVFRLMQPYLSKGHYLYMGNYYNSVALSEELWEYQTHTIGTLRANRKDNPKT